MTEPDKDHPCKGCTFNYNKEKCLNIIEFDAQCDDRESQDKCLFINPKKGE